MAHQPLQTRANIFEWEWGGVGWSGLGWSGGGCWLGACDEHALSTRPTCMSCLALRRGKGLAPPLTEIFANCQDLFLTFEFSLIFNQGKGGMAGVDNYGRGISPLFL